MWSPGWGPGRSGVVLKRTVVDDWRFANLSGSRLVQSHSEDDFRSGCRNVSHQQQFFSELHSPGRSHNTNYWYSWLQTIYHSTITDCSPPFCISDSQLGFASLIIRSYRTLALGLIVKAGAPNDRFLSYAFKRCFRLRRVLLKLCRLILGCAKKNLSVRLF